LKLPLNRRSILAGTGATLISGLSGRVGATAFEWQTVASSEAHFSDLEIRFDRLVAEKRVWNLHGVIVARGGVSYSIAIFEGAQNSWSNPIKLRDGHVIETLAQAAGLMTQRLGNRVSSSRSRSTPPRY
jgi:hypothetical protein